MTWSQIDFFFPYFVFFYGVLMVFVLETPALQHLTRTRFSAQLHLQLTSHKTLAWVCFFIGGLWSLQNILIS